MALIQLLDGSIPIDNDVAPVVVLSEIRFPAVALIVTGTLAIFLMVIYFRKNTTDLHYKPLDSRIRCDYLIELPHLQSIQNQT